MMSREMNIAAELIPTRQSLLSRLKNREDNKSWQDFFDTYWKLIYSAGRKAGLTDTEAQDLVQETIISVLKNMSSFVYDPAKGSFKSWLSTLTNWRIVDQLRKRQKAIALAELQDENLADAFWVENIEDPTTLMLEKIWDEEWERNIIDVALERVKKKIDSKHYQIFDLHVLKKWPVLKVANTLSINFATVYLVKHRVGKLFKREISELQNKPI